MESEVEELVGVEKANYCIQQQDRGKGQKEDSRSRQEREGVRAKEVHKSLWDKEAMRERGVLVCVSSQRPGWMDGWTKGKGDYCLPNPVLRPF